jgi:uncharacterized protein YjiS (DUF1127 family)
MRMSRASLSGFMAGLFQVLRTWYRRASERRELLRLGDGELRDFGVSRSEAMGEFRKPFWRR